MSASGDGRDWEVSISPGAVRDLDRLPPRMAIACVEFVTTTLTTNPLRLSKDLTGDLTGFRSARRGDYRVLFELDDDSHLIHVVRIAHRRDAYRPF